MLTPDNRLYGKMEIDPDKIVYNVQGFDLKEAAKIENKGRPRKISFIGITRRFILILYVG